MPLPDTLLAAIAAALLALLVMLVGALSRRSEARAMAGAGGAATDPYRHVCAWCGQHAPELVRCAHGADVAPFIAADAGTLMPPGLRAALATTVQCPREVCYDCAMPAPTEDDDADMPAPRHLWQRHPVRPAAYLCPEHAQRPFGALLIYWPRAADADVADVPGHN